MSLFLLGLVVRKNERNKDHDDVPIELFFLYEKGEDVPPFSSFHMRSELQIRVCRST
jgi:hypothetical protein